MVNEQLVSQVKEGVDRAAVSIAGSVVPEAVHIVVVCIDLHHAPGMASVFVAAAYQLSAQSVSPSCHVVAGKSASLSQILECLGIAGTNGFVKHDDRVSTLVVGRFSIVISILADVIVNIELSVDSSLISHGLCDYEVSGTVESGLCRRKLFGRVREIEKVERNVLDIPCGRLIGITVSIVYPEELGVIV